jgi:hypothetical protein
MSDRQKPIPRPAPESVPYWRAAAERRFELPHCNACSKYYFPPARSCPHCLSADVGFAPASGRGKVFSFVVFDRVYHPAFEAETPYAVALIELEEGPRMISNVIGVDPEKLRCEAPVTVVFDEVADGVSIPKFRPADDR